MSKDVACDGTLGPNEDGTPNIGDTLAGNISRPSHKASVCEQCGRCCLTGAELRKHLVAHSTLRPWRCEHCSKSFKRKDNLRRHVRTHERLKTWRCEYCGKSFNSKAVREEHISTHNVTALWSCQTCGKTFARKSSMREHELMTHNRCWVCKRCDRAFERRHDLKRHKVAHKVAETFECHELFDKKGHRTEHLASHAGVKTAFRCEQCGESSSSRIKLDIHLAHHDSTKPFNCSVCGRFFKTKWSAKDHMLTHNSWNPWECPHCDKSFKRKYNLNRHCTTHTLPQNLITLVNSKPLIYVKYKDCFYYISNHLKTLSNPDYSSPVASLVLTDSSQLTSDKQHLEGKEGFGNQINLCRDRGLNPSHQHRSPTPYP
uniref:(California timema) hypothetical protein n=1 Tax=Timema californicum TaxID=61474 RepID=A0A7R9JEZ9_TIMCA|nr:unnamed protein product [Timema californicum]